MSTRAKVELAHRLTVLHNWAFQEDKDTLSALTEHQAKDIIKLIGQIWQVIDRRASGGA